MKESASLPPFIIHLRFSEGKTGASAWPHRPFTLLLPNCRVPSSGAHLKVRGVVWLVMRRDQRLSSFLLVFLPLWAGTSFTGSLDLPSSRRTMTRKPFGPTWRRPAARRSRPGVLGWLREQVGRAWESEHEPLGCRAFGSGLGSAEGHHQRDPAARPGRCDLLGCEAGTCRERLPSCARCLTP